MGFLGGVFGKAKEEVRYMVWYAAADACPTCRAMDGMILLPDSKLHAPHAECQHARGCECSEVICYASESSPPDPTLQALIRSNGGMITEATHKAYEARQRAANPLHRARELQRASSESAAKARQAEEAKDLDAATNLYRESIRLDLDAAELIPADALRLRDLPYLYNRLSLVLERRKESQESLAVIREYESHGLEAVDAMTKRRIRLERSQVGRALVEDSPNPVPPASPVHADWKPDPTGRHELRYWDGQNWTHHVFTGGTQATDPV